MHKRGLCRHAVSVRQSVTFMYSFETNKHIFKFFSPSSSHTFQFFPYQMLWQYSDGNPPPPTGALHACGVRKTRHSRSISGLIDCVSGSTAKCNTHSWASCCMLTLVAGKQCRLLFTGDKVFMTRSLHVTPKTTEQHLIARSLWHRGPSPSATVTQILGNKSEQQL